MTVQKLSEILRGLPKDLQIKVWDNNEQWFIAPDGAQIRDVDGEHLSSIPFLGIR